MGLPSFTGTETFQLRAQRTEQRRSVLMAGVLLAVLLLYIGRRLTDGVVVSDNRVFIPAVGVLVVAIVHQLAVHAAARFANQAGRLLPQWLSVVNTIVELGVPVALLCILHFFSPRGEIAALSAPALLLLPIVILLSILRLRPLFTLAMGIGAGIAHAALVAAAIAKLAPQANTYPVLFSYGVLLMLTGLGAALVSREVRDYVREAVREATAREQERRRLDAMERDLSIARDIQRGLLPSSPPDLPGFDIAGMSRPADQTGGDYYDWQTLPDGRLAIVMADVTGHGIGPALVMAVCRAYARASAPLVDGLEPLLERLNGLIHADVGGGDRFITFAVGLLDPSNSRLDLLSAGHGPSLFYHARDRSIEQFGGDGLPLGILPEGGYGQPRALTLEPGDLLLLLTDGFFEALRPSDNQAFGIERIEQVLRDHARDNSAAILEHIDTAVRAHVSGGPQTDDMTAIVLKRL